MVVARARQAVVRAVAGGEAVASASAAREPAATTVAARAHPASTPTGPRPSRRVGHRDGQGHHVRDSATTPPAKQWGGWGGVCDAPCIPTHQRGTGRGCWDRGNTLFLQARETTRSPTSPALGAAPRLRTPTNHLHRP